MDTYGLGGGVSLLGGKAERVGVFSSENRKLWEDLTVAFHYLKGAFKKDEKRV